jgi:hypothetical protein
MAGIFFAIICNKDQSSAQYRREGNQRDPDNCIHGKVAPYPEANLCKRYGHSNPINYVQQLFMEVTRSDWIAVVAHAKTNSPPCDRLAWDSRMRRSALEKAPPKQQWRDDIPRMHNDAASNENKILHLKVR